MNQFSNKIKLLALAALAAAIPLMSQAQIGTSQVTPTSTTDYTGILLPFSTITGVASTGATTNLASGWPVVTSTTNITTLWSSASAAFVNTTNVTSVTNTVYANFSASGQTKVPLQIEFNANSNVTGTSNYYYIVARSVTGVNYDTANNTAVTNLCNGTTNVVANGGGNVIDMTGFNYGRIVSFTFADTATGHTVTNLAFVKSNKKTPNN